MRSTIVELCFVGSVLDLVAHPVRDPHLRVLSQGWAVWRRRIPAKTRVNPLRTPFFRTRRLQRGPRQVVLESGSGTRMCRHVAWISGRDAFQSTKFGSSAQTNAFEGARQSGFEERAGYRRCFDCDRGPPMHWDGIVAHDRITNCDPELESPDLVGWDWKLRGARSFLIQFTATVD